MKQRYYLFQLVGWLIFLGLALVLPGCGANQGAVVGGQESGVVFTPYPPMPVVSEQLTVSSEQIRGTETLNLSKGWSTISFPADHVISTGTFAYALQYYQDGQYVPINPASGLSSALCQKGFWAMTNSASQVTINASDQEGPGSLTLQAGWNLIAFPLKTAKNFSDLSLTYNGETKALSQAASLSTSPSSAWLYGLIQYYKSNRWYQLKTENGANQLVPWKGYWVFCWQDGVRFNFAQGPSGNLLQIAGGGAGGYALRPDGTVWAWGFNEEGELGNGANLSSFVPVQVSNLTGITAIAGGGNCGYALKPDGTVWAWGWNGYGQLGNGADNDSNTPVRVSNLTGVTAIAGGQDTGYALKSDGTVWAWGCNGAGGLGNGTGGDGTADYDSNIPVRVSNLTGATAIAGGGNCGYALKSNGTVWAWGYNAEGELGNGNYDNSNTPVQVIGLSGVAAIAGGWTNGYALKSNGTVWAWGYNAVGELGNGLGGDGTDDYDSNIPVQVSNLTGVTAIAGGDNGGYALEEDGTVWTWGCNVNGELGNGLGGDGTDDYDSNIPVQASNLTGVTAIAAGSNGGYALEEDGTVWAWGYGADGELGNGTYDNSNIPVQVLSAGLWIGISDVRMIAGEQLNGLALKTDGTVWDWGFNLHGELGNGTINDSNVPVQVSGLSGVTAIAEGNYSDSGYALEEDGTIWAWGLGSNGELGNGANSSSSTPVPVSNLSEVTAIAGSGYGGYALKSDCTVWAWGWGGDGELGDGAFNWSNTPVPVSNLTGVTAIAGGWRAGYVLKSDGTVWAWGCNVNGELGNGRGGDQTHTYDSNIPVQVSNLTGVTAIAGGCETGYALEEDGTVWAWGWNYFGELGNGRGGDQTHTYDSNIPVQVSNLTGVTAIAASGTQGYALKEDGTVWAWGWNNYYSLGDGTNHDSNTPVRVSGLTNVSAIAAGGLTGYALKHDGSLWAWGNNRDGELGDGTWDFGKTPITVGTYNPGPAFNLLHP